MIKALYVDSDKLNEKIEQSGLKITYLCDTLALSRQGFDKKRNGKTPFKAAEVYVLCDLLSINTDDKFKIFYPKEQLKGC